MPLSPYISQSSYASRPYNRGNTNYNQTSTTIPSYGASKNYGVDVNTSSITIGYRAGVYSKSKLPIPENSPVSTRKVPFTSNATSKPPPFHSVGRYKSSDNIPESQTLLELKLRKSNSNSALLSGNTANVLKNFTNKLEDKSPTSYMLPRAKFSDKPVESKYGGKSGGPSVFASQYIAKINKGREFRPREIDTRDINITDKPKVTPGFRSNAEDSNVGNITRNSRHVVRFTIKREEPDDPFVVKDKTIKTIAQRLIEKYTEKEKKPDPFEYVPRKRLYEENSSSSNQRKDEKSDGVGTASPSSIVTSSIASETKANNTSKDSTISTTSRKKSLVDLRAALSQQNSIEEEGDGVVRLLRATSTAAKKKELENPEEVKDAIIAAVLHPDVDIESDEEMKELVHGSRDACSDTPDKKGEGEATDSHSEEGKSIVVQLKRYVKKQFSTKSKSKKRNSESKRRSVSQKSEKRNTKLENRTNESSEEEEERHIPSICKGKEEKCGRDESSLLTSDLIFGTSTKKRSMDKQQTYKDTKISETCDRQGKSSKGKGDLSKDGSLLSAALVLNHLTSDEEIETYPPTPTVTHQEHAVESTNICEKDSKLAITTEPQKCENKQQHKNLEIEGIKIRKSREESEKVIVSSIGKIKKKSNKKEAAATASEDSTKVIPKIKVSPVGSSSDCSVKGLPSPAEEENVNDFKETEEKPNAFFSEVKKKTRDTSSSCRGKSSTSRNNTPESSDQVQSGEIGAEKSSLKEEIRSVLSEKSSGDGKMEKTKIDEENYESDITPEIKTFEKREEAVLIRDNNYAKEYTNASEKSTTDCETTKCYKERVARISKKSFKSKNIDILNEIKLPESIDKMSKLSKSKFQDEGSKQRDNVTEKLAQDIFEKSSKHETQTYIANENKEIKEISSDEPSVEKKEGKDKNESDYDGIEATKVVKKAIKRPRQVGPPPPQENTIGTAELLNARKILKRPVKKIGIFPAPVDEKQTQPLTPEDPQVKVWKRAIPQLVPPKEGDQFLQARNVLKKPGKPKIDDKLDKIPAKLADGVKVRKFKKPGAMAAKLDQNESTDDENDEAVKKGDRPKRPVKLRGEGDKKQAPTPPPAATPTATTSSRHLESPPDSSQPQGSGKLSSISKKTSSGSSGKDPKLSACQSADSGYGSSPSTPQPTQNQQDAKEEEVCT
ncbi:hypothetical protein SK128_014973, partial [Halocaridina rubra]